jgi:hypothetical protein
MSDDFKYRVALQASKEFGARRAALHADLAAHEQNGDETSGAESLRQLAELDLQERAAANLYQRHLDAQQPPAQRYVSDEQRAARQPSELDAQDLANMMNQSRYRGRGFSADDYNRLRSGLGWYRATRGTEQK